jgi:hypothetical protein
MDAVMKTQPAVVIGLSFALERSAGANDKRQRAADGGGRVALARASVRSLRWRPDQCEACRASMRGTLAAPVVATDPAAGKHAGGVDDDDPEQPGLRRLRVPPPVVGVRAKSRAVPIQRCA